MSQECDKLGGYYTWREAISKVSSFHIHKDQGICPPGWHVPSKDEFEELLLNTDMMPIKLLEQGSSGFNAKLSGYKAIDNRFFTPSQAPYFAFWSSTLDTATDYAFHLFYNDDIRMNFGVTAELKGLPQKNNGLCIRCLKND